jgi:hypothetical protein
MHPHVVVQQGLLPAPANRPPGSGKSVVTEQIKMRLRGDIASGCRTPLLLLGHRPDARGIGFRHRRLDS